MTISGVELYFTDIPAVARTESRQAERAAVAKLVEQAFGVGTQLSHYSDGAPYVVGTDATVSVSHCRGLAVLAVDRQGRHIGVDVERQRSSLRRVAERLLSADERRWSDDDTLLLAAWTIKEATYKALRPTSTTMSMLQIALPSHPTATGTASGVGFTVKQLSPDTTLTVAIA